MEQERVRRRESFIVRLSETEFCLSEVVADWSDCHIISCVKGMGVPRSITCIKILKRLY